MSPVMSTFEENAKLGNKPPKITLPSDKPPSKNSLSGIHQNLDKCDQNYTDLILLFSFVNSKPTTIYIFSQSYSRCKQNNSRTGPM